MAIGYINFNKIEYHDYGELYIEQINEFEGMDVLFINASDHILQDVISKINDVKVCSMGFSPLDALKFNYAIKFYLCCMNLELDNKYYDFNEEKIIQSDDVSYFIRYIKGYINKSLEYEDFYTSLSKIRDFIISVDLKFINKDRIISELDYDEFILNFLSYQYIHCEYADLNKGIWRNLNNKTINNELLELSFRNKKRGGKWSDMHDTISDYVNNVNSRNIESLLFYYSFIISKALFYKNLKKSALAYSYLHRGSEIIALYFSIKRGLVYEDSGVMLDKATDKRIMGVHYYFKNLEFSKILNVGDNLYKIISIRNNSLLGHGFFMPNLDSFDMIYQDLKSKEQRILSEDEIITVKKYLSIFKLHNKNESKLSFSV